tara:strand:- start:141 stop:1232 length:1092 start_codon:yes stop_codon:yes gene_type:complete
MGEKSQLVHNFSAGPGALPKQVIERVRKDIPNWNSTGMSITEISHRSKEFVECASQAESNLRSLLNVPDDYHVLFLQGGASLQFSMIPMNLGEKNSVVDYVVTGSWGNKAVKEAKKYKHVNIASDSITNNYTSIIDENTWSRSEEADYIHITSNETIAGVEYDFVPETGSIPLVSDISSTILSRPLKISKFGLVYAGAQKNIGPAGLTIVIVRKDLINHRSKIPALLNYHNYIESQSMYNTPPVFSWYVAGLVFEYLLDCGGLEVIEEINKEKSKLLYDFVDNSEFYSNPVDKKCRSRMNIPFLLKDNSLNELFLTKSLSEGLANLKGHRSVGGMRASIYNATGIDAVRDLIDFMKSFENKFG